MYTFTLKCNVLRVVDVDVVNRNVISSWLLEYIVPIVIVVRRSNVYV